MERLDLSEVPATELFDLLEKIGRVGVEGLTDEESNLLDENILAGIVTFPGTGEDTYAA